MFIKRVFISNFKSIKELSIDLNSSFNVLIGQNNVGKTTIIEALMLWKKCYDRNITSKGKTFYAMSKNLSFSDVGNLRVTDDIDLFNDVGKNHKHELHISVEFVDEEKTYKLGFGITKAQHIDNAYYQINYEDSSQFAEFSKLTTIYNTNLRNMITFTNTRPISNIVSQEPYMYKPQIRKKINRGKGYEVLRNKIVNNSVDIHKIEDYLSRILGKNVKFNEKDKDNKEYIKLYVNIDGIESDILSQGSGFLQIVDIFTSFEFFNSELYVLLIDEPDSHIHLNQQKKLVTEFRDIEKSQALVISHNERFIENAVDNEIIFLNDKDKEKGNLKTLIRGAKKFVIEDLVGEYNDIDRLKNSDKILMVEGKRDKERIIKLLKKYCTFTEIYDSGIYIFTLEGIDSISNKLPCLIQSHQNLVKREVEWILLRDTDCIPQNKIAQYTKELSKFIYEPIKKIIFQNGYEFESTLFNNSDYLITLLNSYYGSDLVTIEVILGINSQIYTDSKNVSSNIYEILNNNYIRQSESRSDKIYSKFKYKDFVSAIDENKIEFLLCKKNIDYYLDKVHEFVVSCPTYKTNKPKLDSQLLFDFYLDSFILDKDTIHPDHFILMKDIMS